MTAKFQLVVRSGVNAGTAYPLEESMITIGRETGNTIVIPDPEVSRKHVRLILQGGTYVIEDLGSTNGTFVDEQRISGPKPLYTGEVVALGDQVSLIFETVPDPNATMLSASSQKINEITEETPPPVKRVYRPQDMPRPTKSYSGIIPENPDPPIEERSRNLRIILIISLILLLCISLSCIVFIIWVDADPTGSRWCRFFPWLIEMLGGVCR